MDYVSKALYKSPIGMIEVSCSGDMVTGLYFCDNALATGISLATGNVITPVNASAPDNAITPDNELTPNFALAPNNASSTVNPVLEDCMKQLDEYFKCERKEFTIRYQLQGTDFQTKVWNELCKIPYGKTVSYGDIAAAAGFGGSSRAAGGAIGSNKISIIIPCHRVIGKNGKLTGYAGGLQRKEWLLNHEKYSIV